MQRATGRSSGYSFIGLADTATGGTATGGTATADTTTAGTATNNTATAGTATTKALTWQEQAAKISADAQCIPEDERTKIMWAAIGGVVVVGALCFCCGRYGAPSC
jgi:hypothetical protein